MKLVPYESYSLLSPLSPDDIMALFRANTLTVTEYVNEIDKRIFTPGFSKWPKPFWGEIKNRKFEIKRLIRFRNPSNPKIFGLIKPSSNGSIIYIRMRPHWFVLFSFSFGFLMTFWLFLVLLVAYFKNHIQNESLGVAAFLSISFYALLVVPFRIETSISKKILLGLLKDGSTNMPVHGF